MKPIKDYKDVKVGDKAYENPDAGGNWNNEQGEVVWKGTAKELKETKYHDLLDEWLLEDDMTIEDIDENYNLVIIDDDDIYGPVLYNYNCDPSGVVCFETTTVTMRFMVPVEITWTKDEEEIGVYGTWEEFLEEIDQIDDNPGMILRNLITDDNILEKYHDAIDNGNIEPIKIIKS